MKNLWSDRMIPYFPDFNVLGDRETMNGVYENLIRSYTKPILYASSSEKINMIVDVNIIVPNKVVEVTFADGSKEKSVCHEPDVFSLEQAISICNAKKIMGGSSKYNNAVKAGMKVYQEKLKTEAAGKAEQERIVKKRTKRLAYMKHRKEKIAEAEAERLQTEREEMIEIQKEAYVRAMKEINVNG